MAQGEIARYVADVISEVEARAKSLSDGLDEAFAGEPYGASRPSHEETVGFVRMIVAQYPPEWWTFPDGHTEYNSAWLIACRDGLVEGGRQAWRQIERALRQDAGRSIEEVRDGRS